MSKKKEWTVDLNWTAIVEYKHMWPDLGEPSLRMGFFQKVEFDAWLISSTIELTHVPVLGWSHASSRHTYVEELHYNMKCNNRILSLYEELNLLNEQLDHYKAGQADRKTILSLINGGCWRRNFRSTTSIIRNKFFNLTGLIQPATIVKLCNDKDDDGLMDR